MKRKFLKCFGIRRCVLAFSEQTQQCHLQTFEQFAPSAPILEGEVDGSLPFLEVRVTRVASGMVTSLYRKPTFTGLYTPWVRDPDMPWDEAKAILKKDRRWERTPGVLRGQSACRLNECLTYRIPTPSQSNLIYLFECRHCKSRYVGKTSQRFGERIKQHVPKHLVDAPASKKHRGRQSASPLKVTRQLRPLAGNEDCRKGVRL